MRARCRRAFSLVEIMVVVVILMIVAAVLLPRYLRGGNTTAGKAIQGPQTPIQRAHEVDCLNFRNQIRQAWQMAAGAGGEEGEKPRSLADLKRYGISDEMTRCPVGHEPYLFNPETGEVKCQHPGHR
jgi:hypothetical protein